MSDDAKLSDKRLLVADGYLPDGLTHFWTVNDDGGDRHGHVERHEFRGIIRAPIGCSGFDVVGCGRAIRQSNVFLERDSALAAAAQRVEAARWYLERLSKSVRETFAEHGVDIDKFLAARAAAAA